ncbi:murein hydrolase activator EnvC family protein [Helicobacter cetorum]|uniref:murein hydrolase activator EnvC family protein n=1 Tax=Helicobacter cetorum TaxID=138563 RepID=UPI000CF04678|nr:peptidoglycan DD-metalloendopeptidase family protein [Helicobacter cetorum]
MPKFGVFLVLVVALVANASDVNQDIKINQNRLKKTHQEKLQLNSRLNALGGAIVLKERQKKEIENQIALLKKSLEKNRNESLSQEKTLEDYRSSLESLQQKKSHLQGGVLEVLLKNLLFSQALEKQNLTSPHDVVLQVAFENLHKNALSKIAQLSEEEKKLGAQMLKTKDSIQKISIVIDAQKSRHLELKTLQAQQSKLINEMQKDKLAYNQRLDTIEKERQNLNSLLKHLNIIKQTKEKEALEKRQEQERLSRAKNSKALDVKQVANSYKNINTIVYKGPKTIAPLNDYEVVQKFGPYIDPVYNLKIFSESVTLVPKTPNALVRNVLDGKIVFAKEINMLKKVVVIEHKNGIRTIYSQLDKIAPTIKSGMHIQKGYVLGRIEQRLSFEVTMKEKHINPLELIAHNN